MTELLRFEDGLCIASAGPTVVQDSPLSLKRANFPSVAKALRQFLAFMRPKFCGIKTSRYSLTKVPFSPSKSGQYFETTFTLSKRARQILSEHKVDVNELIKNWGNSTDIVKEITVTSLMQKAHSRHESFIDSKVKLEFGKVRRTSLNQKVNQSVANYSAKTTTRGQKSMDYSSFLTHKNSVKKEEALNFDEVQNYIRELEDKVAKPSLHLSNQNLAFELVYIAALKALCSKEFIAEFNRSSALSAKKRIVLRRSHVQPFQNSGGPSLQIMKKRMTSVLNGYQKGIVTKPSYIPQYERSKANKSLVCTPVYLKDISTESPLVHVRKNWNKEKARNSFTQGPVPLSPVTVSKGRKLYDMIAAVVKIQRWFKRRRMLRKLKSCKANKTTFLNLNIENRKGSIVKLTQSPNMRLVRKHEKMLISKIMEAAKLNTVHYLKKKEQNNQLRPQYINIKDQKGNTPLYYAASANYVEVVKMLLKNGANPNTACENGDTALHAAFKGNYKESVGLLLYYRANPEVPNSENKTPLFYAVPETAKRFGVHKGLIFNYRKK